MGALCGFTGPAEPALLARMAETIAHRGRGAWIGVETPLASLAVRRAREPGARLDATGVTASDGRALALAGYLLGLPAELATPERLLERFVAEGPGFVAALRGAFVMAIADGPTLHLYRDGVGVRTLYWGRAGGRIGFAIEPKGVLAMPELPRRLRPASLAQYLSMSFVPGRHTMLEDLFELEAGHRLEAAPGGEPRTLRWFVFEDDACAGEDDTGWVERFRALHGQAVAERLPPREPVGIFLSGGLDSSAVAAEAAARHDAPVTTWSLHFGPKYPHELSFARAVAGRCGTRHHEVLLRPKEFLPRLRRIVWHLDDAIGDPITVPNFELASHVAREVTTVLNGEGGDPCFGGPKNIPMLLSHWYGGPDRAPRHREREYLASYRRSYEEWPRLLVPELSRRVDAERDLEAPLTPFFEDEPPKRFLNKLQAMNIRLKGAHLILPKVDRMTGAWGLTVGSPLFDERLVRASFEMPARLKLSGGVEKIVLKRAYADSLPREVIERPKSGMRVPVHFWFQGELERYARKLLSRRELERAGIFDPRRVERLLAYDIEEGPGRYGLRLWMLITFEIWRRIVIEREPV
jgi:asparagine synthase (glutamine-hydrolysing)